MNNIRVWLILRVSWLSLHAIHTLTRTHTHTLTHSRRKKTLELSWIEFVDVVVVSIKSDKVPLWSVILSPVKSYITHDHYTLTHPRRTTDTEPFINRVLPTMLPVVMSNDDAQFLIYILFISLYIYCFK